MGISENMQSEEVGILSEKTWLEKYSIIDSQKRKLLSIINECLAIQDEDSISALYTLYSDENFVKLFEGEKEMIYIYMALKIYRREIENNEKTTVFTGHYNIADVIGHIREIKFQLWRAMFAADNEAEEWLHDNIQNGFITDTCVDTLREYYCLTR